MAKKLNPIKSTQLLVVKGKKGNRFKFEGFLFDRVDSGIFESEERTSHVLVLVFRKTKVYQGRKVIGKPYVHTQTFFIAYFGNHDDCHRLVKAADPTQPRDPRIDATYFEPGDVVMVMGHHKPITLAYLKRHAQR